MAKETVFPSIWDKHWLLTVLDYDSNTKKVLCKCDCWVEKRMSKYYLDKKKSCWCRWNVFANSYVIWDWIFNPKEKKEDKRFHKIFLWIHQRVWKKKWRDDIECERKTFKEFYNDMYASYIEHMNKHWLKQTTIDRINPYWNYSKENCRWATYSVQMWNRRWLDKYIIWDKKYTLNELTEITWITMSKVYARYKKYVEWKMTEEEMLFKWRLKWNKYCRATPRE